MTSTDKKIDALAVLIEKLLMREVAPIAPIAPVAPVLPIQPPNEGDHDLLLRIDTKVERVIADVQKINDNFANRIDALEKNKLNLSDFATINSDHETRLRTGENFREGLSGKLSILAGIVAMVVSVFTAWLYKTVFK